MGGGVAEGLFYDFKRASSEGFGGDVYLVKLTKILVEERPGRNLPNICISFYEPK